MRSRSRVVTLVAGFFIGLATLAGGQTGTASLRGTVSDPSAATVPNAKVTLINKERGFERTIMTASAGGYEFLQVPPGTYQLDVEMAGFRKHEQPAVQLLVDNPVTINVKLSVGAANEVIEVTAQGAVINTSDASLGNAFDEHQVKDLPMEGRNVPDLLSLQAGVAYTGDRPDINTNVDTRSGAVNGARSDQSNITLDGVD